MVDITTVTMTAGPVQPNVRASTGASQNDAQPGREIIPTACCSKRVL
jgi:hypothetical protein